MLSRANHGGNAGDILFIAFATTPKNSPLIIRYGRHSRRIWSKQQDLNLRPLPPQGSALPKLSYISIKGIGFSHSGTPISFSQPFSLVSLTNCGLMRRVIHEPAATSRAVSGALSMALLRKYWVFNLLHAVTVPTQTSARLVGRVGVEPTTLKRTDLQSAAFADSLPTQINAVRWKQPQTPLRLSLITLFCLSILEEPDIAPILWRDRRHRRFFLLWFLNRCSSLRSHSHLVVYALMGALNTKEDLYGGTDGA